MIGTISAGGRRLGAVVLCACAFAESGLRAESNGQAGDHWAFQPMRAPSLDVLPGRAEDHPIDRFIAAGREKAGTRAVAAAGRATLIRRASFDLTGLPPSPEEVRAFLNDSRPDAFDRVIEALLASPRYGERWGRYWLDLVRYADTAGDDSDYPIPQAYLYRDYVIDAFNADLPYDRFLHEQLAGDLLAREAPPERFASLVVATGYLAQTKRFGTRKHEDMHLMIEDTLNTTGEVVLGMSLRCARCHDHKHDPVTTADYYALYGVFQSIVYPHPGSEEKKEQEEFIPLVASGELAKQVADYEKAYGTRATELRTEIARMEKEVGDKKERTEKIAPLQNELVEIETHDPRLALTLAYAVKEGKETDVKIQVGGNPHKHGPVVARGAPKFLPGGGALEIPEGQSGRVELAKWLTSPDNPLTARVMANRIWQHHFGTGLVSTPSDFGLHGERPTHPELLDWLALRFIESGWSIKAMHRLIMSSDTWQRSSEHDSHNAEIDPSNASYWRFDRRRLDAEAIRDSMLLIGGNLNLARPGPHPFPPSKEWRFTAHHQFKAVYPSNHRSVFLMVQRLHPHPYLSLFNGPSTTASTPVRDDSTLPLQALFVANSDFVQEQAKGLAGELLDAVAEAEPRLERMSEILFGRPPTEAEREKANAFLTRYLTALEAEETPPDHREQEAWTALSRVLLASNEFFYVD